FVQDAWKLRKLRPGILSVRVKEPVGLIPRCGGGKRSTCRPEGLLDGGERLAQLVPGFDRPASRPCRPRPKNTFPVLVDARQGVIHLVVKTTDHCVGGDAPCDTYPRTPLIPLGLRPKTFPVRRQLNVV